MNRSTRDPNVMIKIFYQSRINKPSAKSIYLRIKANDEEAFQLLRIGSSEIGYDAMWKEKWDLVKRNSREKMQQFQNLLLKVK